MILFELFSAFKNFRRQNKVFGNKYDKGYIAGYEKGFERGVHVGTQLNDKLLKSVHNEAIEQALKRLNADRL